MTIASRTIAPTLATGPSTAPLIRDFPVGERPRERLRNYGAGHLSNAELLAILLRTGTQGENVLAMASRILARFEGLATLSRTSFDELCAEKGLSEAKSCQLLAALELGRRVSSLSPEDRVVISSPKDIANLFMAEMSMLEREELRVLLLNTKNQVIGVERLYQGSVNSALVRPAEVFTAAVRRTCPAIAVVHNHPSGDPTPSPEDVSMTARLIQAGEILDIEVLDHVVIGAQRYVSLKERKLGFE
ncbi:MAG: DNA repair protein RadC [Chloroflexi bacterium]|nr:DNA repair protein RadC [Chloroflexota bacterium]